jgi:hypothetical protein
VSESSLRSSDFYSSVLPNDFKDITCCLLLMASPKASPLRLMCDHYLLSLLLSSLFVPFVLNVFDSLLAPKNFAEATTGFPVIVAYFSTKSAPLGKMAAKRKPNVLHKQSSRIGTGSKQRKELDVSNDYADTDLSSGEEVIDYSTEHQVGGLSSEEAERCNRATRGTGLPASEATSSDYDANEEHDNGLSTSHSTNGHSSDEDPTWKSRESTADSQNSLEESDSRAENDGQFDSGSPMQTDEEMTEEPDNSDPAPNLPGDFEVYHGHGMATSSGRFDFR